jgi:hypothetical protein
MKTRRTVAMVEIAGLGPGTVAIEGLHAQAVLAVMPAVAIDVSIND